MKLYTFAGDGQERLGAETAGGFMLDLNAAHRLIKGQELPAFASMQSFIEAGDCALDVARTLLEQRPEAAVLKMQGLPLLSPLPRPRKIRDFSTFERHLIQATEGAARMLAKNRADPEAAYAEMRRRFNLDSLPGPGWYEVPAYYYSDCTTVCGHDAEVKWPAYSNWADYELELAAIIGKQGKDISRDDAPAHIFGYTIFNDLSARDAQMQAMSTGLGVAKGKDFDDSNVLGPCIMTADEIPDPYELTMRARVNGVEWSSVAVKEARWRFVDCIAYASQSQTVYPGEVFASGAGAGGCALETMRMIHRGDVVELEVDRIGVLRTHIV